MAELVDATDSKSVSSRSAGSSPALGTTLIFKLYINLVNTIITVLKCFNIMTKIKARVGLLSNIYYPKTSIIALSMDDVIWSKSSFVEIKAGERHNVLLYPGTDLLVAPIIIPWAIQLPTTA